MRQMRFDRMTRAFHDDVALPRSARPPGGDVLDDRAPALPRKTLLALAGAAVVLLGCQTDPGGTAPGGLEPSASMQRSEDRDETSPSGGPSDAQDPAGAGGETSGGAAGGGGGASGGGSSGGGGGGAS